MLTDPPVRKLLVLAANPKEMSPLRLDEEVREISEGLRRSHKRDQFELQQKFAVRPRDIQRALLDINPQIVHFSGHGEGEAGLIFEDDVGQPKLVTGEALSGLFALFADQIECIVLNGCYSEKQAEAIATSIPYVIGMKKNIGERAAIEFAVGFYDALGAGRSVEFAYQLGCSAIQIAGIDEYSTPVLVQKTTQTQVPMQTPASPSTHHHRPSPSMLTAGERRRLQQECREIQAQIDSFSAEIQFLQQAQTTSDLSPKEQFRLKKQIEAAQAERQQLNEKISTLEDKLA